MCGRDKRECANSIDTELTPNQNFAMPISFVSARFSKNLLALSASLLLAVVFTGCAAGPLQSGHSGLPSGYSTAYQGQPNFGPQSFGPQNFGQQISPQYSQGFRGGALQPYAAGSGSRGQFSSGSC